MPMVSTEHYGEYFSALVDGNTTVCREIVDELLDRNNSALALYEDLFKKSLYQIGSLWQTNQISIAAEHLATAITERELAHVHLHVVSQISPNHHKALVCCVSNEYHQIGARMVADFLETLGWKAYYAGANTPVEDLLVLIEEVEPDILGLSLSVYFNMAELFRLVGMVRACFPDLEILVGGQAFLDGAGEIEKKYSNLQYIDSLKTLKARI